VGGWGAAQATPQRYTAAASHPPKGPSFLFFVCADLPLRFKVVGTPAAVVATNPVTTTTGAWLSV
jgi:hypothetical protein